MDDMIYYKNGLYYDVHYDIDDLNRIKNEAIENASCIIHQNYNGNYRCSPYYRKKARDPREIRNYKQELISIQKDSNGRNEKIYHYEYDEYLFPHIVSLIDRLKLGSTEVLDEIYNPDYVKEFVPVYYKIHELEQELIRTDDKNLNKKLEILYELKYQIKIARDEKIDIPVEKYYKELQEAIYLYRLNTLELS